MSMSMGMRERTAVVRVIGAASGVRVKAALLCTTLRVRPARATTFKTQTFKSGRSE
jgi:hypothetical protein